MARFKPAGSRKAKSTTKSSKGYIPCIVVILLGFVLIFLLMFAVMRSGK
jgi:hypothetical protein